ncbi:MAG: hypothetical protein VYC03_02530, partial [Pseudomonadota bacterium]|nr:hypothetical protein [Pseudomonadota bacterium]
YVRYYVDGTDRPPFEFLHDLKNDPDQLTNLAPNKNNETMLNRMRARCDQLIAGAGPAMKDIENSARSRKKQ